MPPVFEKEYEYESQHPFPDTVLAFYLKRRSLPGWPKSFGRKPPLEN